MGDDAFLGSRGGNVFPIIRNEHIRMIKEEIKVILYKDSCQVFCKFWFKNQGTKNEDIFMGFPDYIETPGERSNALRNFTCKTNGIKTRFDKQTQITKYDSDTLSIEYEKWYCWDVGFKPDETVIVENSYVGGWGGSADGTCSFSYLIGTAQTWFGTIANGKVIFDYSKVASEAFIDTVSYSDKTLPEGLHRTIYSDSTVFSFQDYLPKWNETLKLNLLSFWKCPYREFDTKATEYPFSYRASSDHKKDKNTLRLMRNEVYARHGYIFQDVELQKYFLSDASSKKL